MPLFFEECSKVRGVKNTCICSQNEWSTASDFDMAQKQDKERRAGDDDAICTQANKTLLNQRG
jgi:hypothetical protein